MTGNKFKFCQGMRWLKVKKKFLLKKIITRRNLGKSHSKRLFAFDIFHPEIAFTVDIMTEMCQQL